MKRVILSILTTLGILVLLPVSMARAAGGQSIIAGNIYYKGTTNPVTGASVSVVCDGNTLTSPTTSAGAYEVTFDPTACPAGDTATVTATKGSATGTNSGVVNPLATEPTVINLAIVNVSVVPEFGAITGIAAIALGAGAFLVIRRQHTASHKD